MFDRLLSICIVCTYVNISSTHWCHTGHVHCSRRYFPLLERLAASTLLLIRIRIIQSDDYFHCALSFGLVSYINLYTRLNAAFLVQFY
jgi:hypothetical protein